MNENENYVRISVEEYFKLRQQAESNSWLMAEITKLRADLNENCKLLREPTVNDVIIKYVRYYPKVPEQCGCDSENGCYTYCNKSSRGCFPVWVIEFEPLEVKADV